MTTIYLINGWYIKYTASHTIVDAQGKSWTSILPQDIVEIDIQSTRLSKPTKRLQIADDQIAFRLVS